jgi:hypothetical protein
MATGRMNPLWPAAFEQWAEERSPFVRRLMAHVATTARRIVNVRTGALRRSIRQRGNNRVFIDTDHWRFIEFGTRPHRQRHWRTGRVFRHPGTRAYRPMTRALYSRTFRGF